MAIDPMIAMKDIREFLEVIERMGRDELAQVFRIQRDAGNYVFAELARRELLEREGQ